MNVKRKPGKPNRGGGRFNQRGRGRGIGRSNPSSGFNEGKKAGGSAAALGYLGDTVLTAKAEQDDSYISSYCTPVYCKRAETKVSMQRLHMSSDNQEMVRDMLRDLHWGQDTEDAITVGGLGINDSEEYDELDVRSDDQYWMTDTNLVVQELVRHAPHRALQQQRQHRSENRQYSDDDWSDNEECVQARNADDNVSTIAVNTLKRYGFHESRCKASLLATDGDIGCSLEQLLECMKAEIQNGESHGGDLNGGDSLTWDEILEQRVEESTALASIYDESFSERIPNRVWVISLELAHLTALVDDLASSFKRGRASADKVTDKVVKKTHNSNAPLCQYFRRGNCRFGSRCRRRHGDPEPAPRERFVPVYDNADSSAPLYSLEVRFPAGNRYPCEAPLVAFCSINSDLPPHACLNLTICLLHEAHSLIAETSPTPIVFSLIALLDDETRLRDALCLPASPLSLPLSVPQTVSTPIQSAITNNTVHTPVAITQPVKSDQSAETVQHVTKPTKSSETSAHKKESSELMREMTEKQDARLAQKFLQQQDKKAYQAMMCERRKLPAWSKQGDILAALHSHQVVVISGMTGCGKTTQVPQFILDSYLRSCYSAAPGDGQICNIVCTQPRRISAIAVSERVAEERVEPLGGIVGYQIRLEKAMSSATRLLFCSTGILLRRLEGDHTLQGVTHVIIDEVHERNEESDFLMMVLRDLLPQRPDMKVILMSATLNAHLFSEYFGVCPTVDIPGKTFPVRQFFLEDAIEFSRYMLEEGSSYARPLKNKGHGSRQTVRKDCGYDDLSDNMDVNTTGCVGAKDNVPDQHLSVEQTYKRYEDYNKSTKRALALIDHEKINNDLIEAVIERIVDGEHEFADSGAILVFLPGIGEIMSLYSQLQTNPRIGGGRNKDRLLLVPLHSSLSSEEQHAVFSKPKKGVTKIVLATNIAETSITIEDVVFVIDTGRMKEKRYDPSKGMESLDLAWVARANAIQRRGRAGRVAAGVCFHLFTSHRFRFHLRDQPIPEIQRIPLEQIVLKIKMLQLFKGQHIMTVLCKLIEPPESISINCSMTRLEALGAIDSQQELTPLGYHLGSLPVDVRIGKLMLFGAIFRCLDSALTIAAILSYKSPFVAPFDRREEADAKKLEFSVANSDHLTVLKAYQGWLSCKKNFGSSSQYAYCRENFLSVKNLEMLASMKRQFTELLSDIGFVTSGLTVRKLERVGKGGTDGVIEMTGEEANCNNGNLKLVSAILVAALYPNVVQVLTPQSKFSQSSAGTVPKSPNADELKFKTKSDGYVSLHPSSVNFQVRHYDSPYLVYHEKVKTSKVYIRDSTMVSVYPLLLFGGGSITIEIDKGNYVMSVDDGWIRFLVASKQVAELVKELRHEVDQLLEDKIQNPDMDLCVCPRGSRIINTIVKLISTQ